MTDRPQSRREKKATGTIATLPSMGGCDECDEWSREPHVRPRVGRLEKLIWVAVLLFTALVPVMCAVDTGLLYLPRD